ncbi:hypothetical protein FD754_014042, partial [Muntiacus muntjak]
PIFPPLSPDESENPSSKAYRVLYGHCPLHLPWTHWIVSAAACGRRNNSKRSSSQPGGSEKGYKNRKQRAWSSSAIHAGLGRQSTTGTPAISTTTTVEIRKSSVMTAEITSKVEKSPTPASGNSSCPSAETEEEKAKRLLYCSLCKVAVNSASQLEAHNSGEMQPTVSNAVPSPCLQQHISSRRHKDRAAGKPPKPKYSPYNKLQKAARPLGVKLVFSKEPSKPLAPRLLPGPLAAAAAAVAVGSPFGLRAAPPALLPALPPALLRPAPGPMRSAHAPVLFAPY